MQDHNCRKIISLLSGQKPEIQAAIRIVELELELNSVMRAKQDALFPAPEPAPLPLFQFELEEK